MLTNIYKQQQKKRPFLCVLCSMVMMLYLGRNCSIRSRALCIISISFVFFPFFFLNNQSVASVVLSASGVGGDVYPNVFHAGMVVYI